MQRSSHRKRLLTAAVGLPLVLAAVFIGSWALFVLVFVVSCIAFWEFVSLATGEDDAFALKAAGVVPVWMILAGFSFGGPAWAFAALLLAFWLERLEFLRRCGLKGETARPTGALPAGLLYGPCALGFFLVFSPLETVCVLTTVVVSDAGAYYSGRLIGGKKIWPAVSPNKTWAGTLGGLALAMAWSLLYGGVWGAASPGAWLALGAALNIAVQLGDFYESALKRAAGVKDSGALLPGHGGILDRIDGLLPATLVYAAARAAHPFFG